MERLRKLTVAQCPKRDWSLAFQAHYWNVFTQHKTRRKAPSYRHQPIGHREQGNPLTTLGVCRFIEQATKPQVATGKIVQEAKASKKV